MQTLMSEQVSGVLFYSVKIQFCIVYPAYSGLCDTWKLLDNRNKLFLSINL